ncbi:hypothetical protein M0R89_10460 [Halorussus limi]|uniref:Uncharacterized protein n=1 Tax=Halorussus limi TaxID=2938695 RepID=A0A8U0HPT6_9EURY|nr:hypothetical protein [Halorussus limi]UPV72970.1 hypothetical protein M0R89_10460 [Halorussus limi]
MSLSRDDQPKEAQKDAIERQREARETEREWSQHRGNFQRGMQTAGLAAEKAEWLERLAQTDMSDASINLLDNMVDRTFVLGYLNDAEINEIKWRMHTMYLRICALFPPKNSQMQGPVRAFFFDDADQNRTYLTDEQKTIIAQMIIGISVYVSRSKEGFQQEKMVESITVSEVRNPDEDDDDDLMRGIFS